jgi:hypothetical protein
VLVRIFAKYIDAVLQLAFAVNLGIIGYSGYTFYSEPHLRRSPQALSTAIAGSVVLLGLEGYGLDKLRQKTDKDDAAVVSQYFHENPGMFQGLLGACKWLHS